MPRIAEFLRTFPRSNRVPEIVAEANTLWKQAAADVAAGSPPAPEGRPYIDVLPQHIAEYARIVERLAENSRTSACDAAAEAALAINEVVSATRLLVRASASTDKAIATRAKERLSKLPP